MAVWVQVSMATRTVYTPRCASMSLLPFGRRLLVLALLFSWASMTMAWLTPRYHLAQQIMHQQRAWKGTRAMRTIRRQRVDALEAFSSKYPWLGSWYVAKSAGRFHNMASCKDLNSNRMHQRSNQQRTRSSFLASTTALGAWKVGDKVWVETSPPSSNSSSNNEQVQSNNQRRQAAVVTEIGGRGWYTLELEGNREDSTTSTTVKARSKRIQTRREDDSGADDQWGPEALPVMDSTSMFRDDSAAIANQNSSSIEHPSIVDLDAAILDPSSTVPNATEVVNLAQVQHFAQTDEWVVFTDLHVAPSTLDTCLQVLEQVHRVAVQRQAGIIFLGDFWHHRGTLRVDCLNAVLEQMSTWQVPLVMIPGNHDQVTLGGHIHGLTALRNAYSVITSDGITVPGPLIFSHPTVFRQALWIPHVRDHGIMEAILQSSHAQENAKAILCHADVTGASMNDLLVSIGGVPPRWFPAYIPIYSGHFHKAHTVSTRNHRMIEYIGSPYQVSLSEAHQSKALVVMDAKWKIVDRIPLFVGRFHFRPTGLADFMSLQLQQVRSVANDTAVCPGDRVVWSVPAHEWEDIKEEKSVEDHLKSLRQASVAVEIRPFAVETTSSTESFGLEQLEELTVSSTWEAFVESEENRGAWSAIQAEKICAAGLALLASVEGNETETTENQEDPSSTGSYLEFHSLTIEGFGPFVTTVDYPLDKRGLVLVRGANQDSGSDSNGTGKSSLAMASLWALTGALDPRPLPDGKVADVVHDDVRVARVTLKGTRNGKEFMIIRSKTQRGGSLTFLFDGHDKTTQSVRETQLVIDELLGISPKLLFRSVFFGQHPLNDLLDATDTRFKEELASLVPLAVWQEALSVARKRARASEKRIAELDGMVSIRQADLDRTTSRSSEADETFQSARKDFEKLEKTLTGEIGSMSNTEDQQNSTDWAANIGDIMEDLSLTIETLEKERESYASDRTKAEEKFSDESSRSEVALKEAQQSLTECQRALDVAEVKWQTVVEELERFKAEWQLDLRWGSTNQLKLPNECPTCGQRLSEESSSHAHAKATQSLEAALLARQNVEHERVEAQKALTAAKALYDKRAVSLANLEDTQTENISWIKKQIEKVDVQLRNAWREREQHTRDLAETTRKRQMWIEAKSIQQKLDKEREALGRLEAAADTIAEDKRRCEEMVVELETEQAKESDDLTLLKELTGAFGQRGIQVFVLRNALEALQAVSQTYLDELSDSTLELNLFLDDGDRILRQVAVSSGSEKSIRSLSSLSGGQWRRCSLALQLGFADLLSRRGHFGSSLLVYDEPLTHLDRSGRSAFGRVLRRLLLGDRSTILLILQDLAAEELEENFDAVDEVVKAQGRSIVKVFEEAPLPIDRNITEAMT